MEVVELKLQLILLMLHLISSTFYLFFPSYYQLINTSSYSSSYLNCITKSKNDKKNYISNELTEECLDYSGLSFKLPFERVGTLILFFMIRVRKANGILGWS